MLSNSDGGNLVVQAFSAVALAEGSFDVLWENPRMINYLYDLVPSERDIIEQIKHIYSTDAAKHMKKATADLNSAESEMRLVYRALMAAGISEESINSSIEYFVSVVPSLSEAYTSLLKWQSSRSADALMRYIALQLSAQNWSAAREHCIAALAKYPEVSELYLYSLMAEYQLFNEADLIDADLDLMNNPSFQKAVLYASAKERQEELVQYQKVQERKKRKYHAIEEGLKRCHTEQDYRKLEAECKSILSFRNTDELLKKCTDGLQRLQDNETTYVRACEALTSAIKYQNLQRWTESAEAFRSAAELLSRIRSYKDSEQLAAKCKNAVAYLKAVGLMERAQSEGAFREAAAAFEVAGGFGDSESRRKQCVERAENSRKELLYQEACGKIDKAKKTGFLNWRIFR